MIKMKKAPKLENILLRQLLPQCNF